MENVVETSSLTKRFSTARSYKALLRFRRRENLTAVDRVTLQIRAGELFGLLGPNGAGKTTLIKMLCTLILPSEGRALVCNRDVVSEAAAVRSLIGLVDCQERSFFWRLTGRQNLRFFAALQGLRGAQAEARIDNLLELVGLDAHADHRFMGYSTGMRQRLGVARGLLSMPRVLFMDEPTRSLDPLSARELRAFIRHRLVDELGHTVVLVTHRLEEAEELCDRVAIMNRGRIIACAPVADVKRHIPAHHKYSLRVGRVSPRSLEGLRAIAGVTRLRWAPGNPHGLHLELLLTDENETLPLVMRYLVSQGGDIQRCQTRELSLEETFVHLVEKDENGA